MFVAAREELWEVSGISDVVGVNVVFKFLFIFVNISGWIMWKEIYFSLSHKKDYIIVEEINETKIHVWI